MTSPPCEAPDREKFVQTTLKVLGGKWKLLILWHLREGAKRYSELKRLIPEISEKMLIQQLKELQKDAIISRNTLSNMPPKVEYTFTDYGKSIIPVLKTLCDWGQAHLDRLSDKPSDRIAG
jgi:DNA-binding HxlR family transcriptional regulator